MKSVREVQIFQYFNFKFLWISDLPFAMIESKAKHSIEYLVFGLRDFRLACGIVFLEEKWNL